MKTVICKECGIAFETRGYKLFRPELGYVKGNVRVISSLANRIKSDLDAQTLRLVLEDLERIENGGV